MARTKRTDPVLVVGLGRFGGALAESLVELGHEVLAVDGNAVRVQQFSGRLTSVVEVDSTDEDALRQIGAQDLTRAVVAIGADMEASILTVGVLVDLGIPRIYAKAMTAAHGRILQRIGATQVVFPEHEMGQRVAHMVTGRMLDYIELDDTFTLVETVAPKELVGRTLGQAQVARPARDHRRLHQAGRRPLHVRHSRDGGGRGRAAGGRRRHRARRALRADAVTR